MTKTECRCGSTEFIDHPISGRRVRRDCKRCGRFHSFTRWYHAKSCRECSVGLYGDNHSVVVRFPEYFALEPRA